MSSQITSISYFSVKSIILLCHICLLGVVFFNGKYENITSVLILSVIVIATDLGYFLFLNMISQKTYTLDYLLILLLNITVIYHSCFGGVNFATKHYIITIIAFLAYQFSYKFAQNPYKIEALKKFYYLAMVLIILSIIFLTGSRGIWIDIKGLFTIQPSELLKPFFVLVCATSIYFQQEKITLFGFRFVPDNVILFLFTIFILGLQWWSRDLGSIPTFFAVAFCALISRIAYPKGKLPKNLLVTALILILILAFIAIIMAPSYVKDRLFVDIWGDMYGNGYQQTRALIAIAEGGLFGKGPGHGFLHNVAAYQTDIIFSTIAEEWGLVSVILVISIILIMLTTALINNPKCYYHSTLAAGVVAVFVVQMSLNIFGSCNLIPFTGVTIPFVSEGGTSMLTSGILLGFLKATQTPVFKDKPLNRKVKK